MNKIVICLILIIFGSRVVAQNVGINQPSPTNSLHISPLNIGDNPLRIDGLQPYNIGDTSLLIINNNTGVVKYITSSDFINLIGGGGLGTDNQQIDSLTLNNYILTAYLEDGGSASTNLSQISDSTIGVLFNNADTLLYNSNFISNLKDSIDTDVDSVTLTGTTLYIYENGNYSTADLSALQDNDGDPTNEYNTSATLNGTTLQITDGGGTINVNLAPLIAMSQTPVGAIFAFPTPTPPTGYLACNGQAVSRTTYNSLFSLIGTMYGNGDGATTFNLPNYNGQFLRGWDNGQGTDPNALTRLDRGDGTTGDAVGTKQTNQTLSHSHSVDPPNTNTSTNGSHNHGGSTGNVYTYNTNTWISFDDNLASNTFNTTNQTPTTCGNPWNGIGTGGNFLGKMNSSCLNHTHTISTDGNHSHSIDIPSFNSSTSGGSETRPTNIYVLWCIKY